MMGLVQNQQRRHLVAVEHLNLTQNINASSALSGQNRPAVLQAQQTTKMTSHVTGRHRAPKRKLRAGYRALSLQRTSRYDAFSSSSLVSRAFSVLCVYSTFGHHPHPLGYVVPNYVCFAASVAELAHGEKSHTDSLNHPAYLMPRDATNTQHRNLTNNAELSQHVALARALVCKSQIIYISA